MKKALVVMMLVLTVGVAAFAAAPFTGEWKTTIGLDVSATAFADFFTKFDSTLKINYTQGSWIFGSSSSFGLTGYKSQSFTATGIIGAFSFASTMAFSPMVVTEWTYPIANVAPLSLTITSQSDSDLAALCKVWKGQATEFGPAFLTWDVTGSVSIAGVTIEGLFFLDQGNIASTKVDYLFLPDYTQTDAVVCAGVNGSGWRFMISGEAAGMTITSYTYFNLYEYTNELWGSILGLPACPTIGMSGVYEIDSPDCNVAFSREYIMAEGFAFGCATIDFALDIDCDGFNSLTALVQNVVIGGWLNLDFSIAFGVDSKTFNSCLSIAGFTTDCYIVEVGFAGGSTLVGNSIGDLTLHGVGLTYSWNGVTFSSYTELTAYSALFSKSTSWTYIYGHDTLGFLVPYCGVKTCASGDPCCDDTAVALTYWGENEAYELKCVAVDRYKLWEKFQLKYASDACCGGAFSFTLDTYFGDYEELLWYGYAWQDTASSTVNITTLYGSTDDAYAYAGYGSATDSTKHCVTYPKAVYAAGDVSTLFGWAKSTVAVSFGLGSNFTLNLGAAIDAFGWNSLDFGFTVTF